MRSAHSVLPLMFSAETSKATQPSVGMSGVPEMTPVEGSMFKPRLSSGGSMLKLSTAPVYVGVLGVMAVPSS